MANRQELAKLLEMEIKGVLHPKSIACYLDAGDGDLVADPGPGPRPRFPFRFGALFIPREADTITATLPLLAELAQRGKAWDVPQHPEAAGDLGPLAPECLVPRLNDV